MVLRGKSIADSNNQGDQVKRLPLFGPLEIEDYKNYYLKSSRRFQSLYLSSKNQNLADPYDFERVTVLGKGAFGIVSLVKSKQDQAYYAMKALNKANILKMNQISHILNEKRVLQCVDFPFCMRMDYFCKDNSYLYFVMPFISGGEMFTLLQKRRKFEERVAKFYAAQVVLGLEFLHHLNIVYRDLKPENLLIDHSGYLKITDFGFTKIVPSRTYTFCGTPHYMAPEIIKGHGYRFSVDWWSLGVLIFEMRYGEPPFQGRNQMVMYKNIINNKYTMPSYFNQDLKGIVQSLLQVDVTKRYGNLKNGVDDIKNHKWFSSINWLIILNRRMDPPFIPNITGESDLSYFPGDDPNESQALKVSNVCQYEEEFKDF